MEERAPGYFVERASDVELSDAALERLLWRVYVDGGFTDADVARSALTAAAVRARGELLIALDDTAPEALLGCVIVVPPTSSSRRLARPDEAEMHLLAVAPEQRGRGIGRALAEAAMRTASAMGYSRMVLWTQPTMTSAHRLYEAAGFERIPSLDFHYGERTFLVLSASLNAK